MLTSCTDKQTKKEIKTHASASQVQSYINQIKTEREEALNRYVAALPLEQKIAQLFIENLEGCTSFRSYETVGAMTGEKDDRPLIAGGYIFFSYNIADTRDQMQTYIKSIRDYCDSNNNLQPYLCVDQEGGWVSRLKKLNPKLPSNEKVAQDFDIAATYQLYAEQADGMKTLGFDMNLAPVVEVCTDDNKDFLDGRSFGNLEQVTTYGRACLNAYENNGIATVLKHFPGNTNTDPHTGLPEIKWTQSEFDMQMASFKTLLEQKPAAILMSHARVKGYDEVLPACLSKYWVTDVLRNKFGYEGIIFSDDIFMGALADNGYPPEQAVVMAIEAGIDCIIISEKRIMDSVEVLIKKAQQDQAFNELLNKAVRRMIDYKIKAGMLYVHLDDSGKYVLSIDYEGCMNNDPSVFAGLKQQNRQFYMDNFYGK